jgi:chromosome segregation ATPase
MPANVTAASFLDAHETRIQSLESQGIETQAILSRLQGDVHHMQSSQDEAYRDLQQLKAMLLSIADKNREGFAEVDKGLRAVAGRVGDLEKIKQESDNAIAAFKRRVFGALVFMIGGVAGTFAAKFGDVLWGLLSN